MSGAPHTVKLSTVTGCPFTDLQTCSGESSHSEARDDGALWWTMALRPRLQVFHALSWRMHLCKRCNDPMCSTPAATLHVLPPLTIRNPLFQLPQPLQASSSPNHAYRICASGPRCHRPGVCVSGRCQHTGRGHGRSSLGSWFPEPRTTCRSALQAVQQRHTHHPPPLPLLH